MPRKPQTIRNPFYALLVLVGVLFVMTAVAYCTLTVREARVGTTAPSGLMTAVSTYGLTALIIELVLLTIGTFGAISTDEYWQRREVAARDENSSDSP